MIKSLMAMASDCCYMTWYCTMLCNFGTSIPCYAISELNVDRQTYPILEVLADLKIDAFFSLYFCLFGSVPPFNRVVKKYF